MQTSGGGRMTKDEIKKGLECCCNSDFKNACRNCSYLTCPGCNDTLCKDALNLITEQEKEINNLKDDYAKLQELFAQYQMASDKEIIAQVKQAKIDVLNELKRQAEHCDQWNCEVVPTRYIDELIKEYGK